MEYHNVSAKNYPNEIQLQEVQKYQQDPLRLAPIVLELGLYAERLEKQKEADGNIAYAVRLAEKLPWVFQATILNACADYYLRQCNVKELQDVIERYFTAWELNRTSNHMRSLPTVQWRIFSPKKNT